jgi:hypothetical protein
MTRDSRHSNVATIPSTMSAVLAAVLLQQAPYQLPRAAQLLLYQRPTVTVGPDSLFAGVYNTFQHICRYGHQGRLATFMRSKR